jgi:hypothetical protein
MKPPTDADVKAVALTFLTVAALVGAVLLVFGRF